MAYRVDYGPSPEKGPSLFERNRIRILTAVFLLLFILAVKLLWPDGTAVLCNVLLPGEASATQTALSSLVDNLRSGEGVSEALSAFCKEIISDAGFTLQ